MQRRAALPTATPKFWVPKACKALRRKVTIRACDRQRWLWLPDHWAPQCMIADPGAPSWQMPAVVDASLANGVHHICGPGVAIWSCKKLCFGFVSFTARPTDPAMGVRTFRCPWKFWTMLAQPRGDPGPPQHITCYLTHRAVAMSLPFCPCARLAVL